MLSTATTTLTLLLAVAMASAAPLDAEHQLLLPREQNPAGFNILGYLPNIPLNAIGAVVFGTLALAQTWLHFKWRARYMWAMTIGIYFYTVGIIVRFPYRDSPSSLGLYIIQDLSIILSPCAFIASIYSILGQLGAQLDAADCLPIRTSRIAKTFIWSDVITFLIQSGGGGLEVNQSMANLGAKIFLIGLILQLISFLTFCTIFVIFLVRLRTRYPSTWEDRRWRPLAWALTVACLGIIIRSVFRTVENSQGFQGYLSVHEGYFWALDALPLAIAVGVFLPFWPARVLRPIAMELRSTISMESVGPKRR